MKVISGFQNPVGWSIQTRVAVRGSIAIPTVFTTPCRGNAAIRRSWPDRREGRD